MKKPMPLKKCDEKNGSSSASGTFNSHWGKLYYVRWILKLSFMWNTACDLIPPICKDKQVCKPFTLLCWFLHMVTRITFVPRQTYV
jgi:hypothetical protein